MDKLDYRELTLIKRAAEDACHAMNRHYKPFIDAVAKPLMIIALVEMAQSRQAEVDALNDNHLAYIDKVIAMESDYLEKIIEKEKRIEELTHLATELAQYASYAEIVGAISHNRQPIREFSDKIFDFNKKVEEEALRGEHG